VFTVTEAVVADAALPHVFVGVTDTVPEVEPIVTAIEVVFEPEVITEPDGTLQVYPVAPLTAEILYVTPVCPAHTVVDPVIEPATAGIVFTVTEAVVANAALPHVFVGVTDTVPEVEPIVTVIEVVLEPDVIVEPDGTLQVYPVAPLTAEML